MRRSRFQSKNKIGITLSRVVKAKRPRTFSLKVKNSMNIRYTLFDGRSKFRRWWKVNGPLYLTSIVMGIMAGIILAATLIREMNNPKVLLNPLVREIRLEVKKVEAIEQILPVAKKKDISTLIKQTFPEDPDIALAIAKAESGLNEKSKGWNCEYEVNGRKVSKACKKEDRGKAWSVDCGVFQVNQRGRECPSHLMTAESNLKIARKKYEGRGNTFLAWSAYKNGSYKKHL